MTTIAGGLPVGFSLFSQFGNPRGLAADAGGNVFVADTNNNRIRRIDWVTRDVSTVAGTGGLMLTEVDGIGSTAQFNYPYGLAMLNGSILVVDSSGGSVRQIGVVYRFF